MQVKLDENFLEELTSNLRSLYKETIEVARRDAGINKEYLTIPEALKLANISRNTLNNNFIAKGLSTYVVEGKVYIKKSEINDFIESHKV